MVAPVAAPAHRLLRRQRHLEVARCRRPRRDRLCQAHRDVEAPVALVERVHRGARKRRLDHRVRRRSTMMPRRARRARSSAMSTSLWPPILIAATSAAPRMAVSTRDRLHALSSQDVQVRAEHLDDDLALRTGQRFLHVVLDHLREIGRHARQWRESSRPCRPRARPCRRTAMSQRGLRSARISRLLGPLGSVPSSGRPTWVITLLHFGIGRAGWRAPALDLLGLAPARSTRQRDREPDVALVQLGQELGAQQRRRAPTQPPARRTEPAAIAPACADRAVEQPPVALLQPIEPCAVLFGQRCRARPRPAARHQRQGQQRSRPAARRSASAQPARRSFLPRAGT